MQYTILTHICVTGVPELKNFTLFQSTTSHFLSYRPFWDKCTEWPQNGFKFYKVKDTPYLCYSYPRVPNFTRFALTPTLVELQAILRKMHQMTPNDLKPYKGQMYPIDVYSQAPNFTPFHCTTSLFPDTGHFETSAQNELILTLNPTRSNHTTYICITSVPESPISLHFSVRPATVEIQAILRQLHWMTPKWPWSLQGQRYPIYVLLVSTSHIFHSV